MAATGTAMRLARILPCLCPAWIRAAAKERRSRALDGGRGAAWRGEVRAESLRDRPQ
jgi:hypothetical protein